MADVLYKKFNISNTDPSKGLITSTKAVNAALKDSISSVKNLLSEQEKKYTEANTIAATEALKKYVRDNGLSAKKIDTEQIRQHFGGMVDTDTVNKAVEDERKNILNKALTAADEAGAKTYEHTGYIGDAQEAVKKNLLNAGAKYDEAVTAANNWAKNNKWRPEEDKQQKEEAIEKIKADALPIIQKGGTKADVIDLVKSVPKEIRGKVYTSLVSLYDTASKLSPEETNNLSVIQNTASNAIANFSKGVDTELNQKITEIGNPTDFVDSDIKATVENNSKKDFSLDSPVSAVGETTDNNIFADVGNMISDIFSSTENDTVHANQATLLVQNKINYLTDRLKVPVKDAKMIVLQAARDALPQSSKNSIGKSLTSGALDKYVRRVYKNYVDNKQKEYTISEMKKRAALAKLKYTQNVSNIMNNYSLSASKKARMGVNNTNEAKNIVKQLLDSSYSSVNLVPTDTSKTFTSKFLNEHARKFYKESNNELDAANKQAALQARLKAIKQSKATEPDIGGKRFKVSPPPKSKKSNDYWTEVAGN